MSHDPADQTRPEGRAAGGPTWTGLGAAGPHETPGHPGDPLAGPAECVFIPGYEVLGELGRGTTGVVFLARQIALGRTVAVKLVGGAASAATRARFRQEAEAVARLQHPNIVQIFEVGGCPAGAFIALEYVDGGTLKDRVAGVPQPPRDAARLVETVARAVHHAHERRVVHRDLKPANVLLTAGRVPKIADFGLARALDAAGGVTLTSDFVGTPAYAAPEQVADQFGPIGPGTDVYALGAVLYELLTGRVPFQADGIPRLLRMVAEAEPVPPRRLRPDVPRDLETICLKCLRKEPGRRYATAAALADDLHRFLAGESVAARPVGRVERGVRWAKRNPRVAALLGLVFTLLTAVAAVATVAAVRIDDARGAAERDRDAARKAEREGKEKLLQSLISEAKADRFSRRVGQRFDTLDAVRRAAELARELEEPAAALDELRDLAAAALALPDLRPDAVRTGPPADGGNSWGVPVPDPTGRLVAFHHQHGAVSLRRAGGGPGADGEVARLPGRGNPAQPLWTADGRVLAVWHWVEQRVEVWRVGDGPPAPALELPGCLGVALTPDGRGLVVNTAEDGGRRSARLFDLASGGLLRTTPLPDGAGRYIAHHPHRPELAVALPTRVAVVDLTTGREVAALKTSGGPLAWHPHGELLGVCGGDGVDVWDVARGRPYRRLPHPGGGVEAGFNPAGDLLVTSGWKVRVRVWNPHTGQLLLTATGNSPYAFGPGDRLNLRFPAAAADPVGPLSVAEPARECRTLPVAPGRGRLTGLTGAAVHPGGRLAAVSAYEGFSLLDLATGAERQFVVGQICRGVLFEPDGSLLVKVQPGPNQPGLYRWPVADGPGGLRVGPPEAVPVPARGESVARSADGAVLAASDLDGGGVVWRRDHPLSAVRVPHPDCRHVAVSPDGRLLATGSWHGRGIKVWDAATGGLVRDLAPDLAATIPAFSPDGRWLVNRNGGQSWRVADGSAGPPAPAGTRGAAFSPDGRVAAWGGNGFVVLTDAGTGRPLARLEDPNQDGLTGLTFGPDGTTLLGVTDDSFTARAWDLRKLRAGLAELGLDWGAPPYPPAGPPADPRPLRVRVAGEELFANPARLDAYHRERVLLTLWANPLDAAARQDLGERLLRANRLREADAQLTAALAVRPGSAAAHRMRADARGRLGDWAGCLPDVEAALAGWPDDLSLLALRADAHHNLGRAADAAAGWKRAAAAATPQTRPVALNNLAWRLLTGPPAARDPARGLELATWAVGRGPANPTFLNTLGVAHYRNGRPADAVPVLERGLAAAKGTHDAFDLFFLAMCRAKLGDRAGAAADYRRAVEWAAGRPNLPPAARAELAAFREEAEAALHAAGVATDPAPPPREG